MVTSPNGLKSQGRTINDLQVIDALMQVGMEAVTTKLAAAVAQHNAEQQAAQETKEEPENG